MGRCNCGSSTCQCSIGTTACLATTGSGTPGDPYLVAPVLSTDVINRVECRSNGLYSSFWAKDASVATSQTTASTSFTDLATVGPTVSTVTTGTRMLVILETYCANNTGNDGGLMSFAVSGATTTAASDTRSIGMEAMSAGTGGWRGSGVFPEVVTAGNQTVTAKYRAVTGGTATFKDRSVIVIPYNLLT